MTTQEFEIKTESLRANQKSIVTEARERMEAFVKDVLGDEYYVQSRSTERFTIGMMRDNARVFGSEWDVYVSEDWQTDEVQVKANIGTCGSFEMGSGDDQEKKYIAFARFMIMFDAFAMKQMLIKCYNDCAANRRAYYALEEEYKQNNQ